jgi:hypothetical protein
MGAIVFMIPPVGGYTFWEQMTKERKKAAGSRHGRRAEGTKDVFARLDVETVAKFDQLVAAIQPRVTRSAVIAHLIEQYVAENSKE